jgi:hypothetical protein
VQVELTLIVKRLSTDFLLHHILAGLITPAVAKTETALATPALPRKPASIR